jgi:hypothetical protein
MQHLSRIGCRGRGSSSIELLSSGGSERVTGGNELVILQSHFQ